MVNKDKIREMIKMIQEFNGHLTLNYLPESVIYSTKTLYGLYYGGAYKIEIDRTCYRSSNDSWIDYNENNLDKIIDKIYDILSNDIFSYFHKAMENLNFEYEELKYFDREESLEKYENFKNEVLRLKNEKE